MGEVIQFIPRTDHLTKDRDHIAEELVAQGYFERDPIKFNSRLQNPFIQPDTGEIA